MTALVDTNVVLDVMLNRKPFVSDSASVIAAVERSECRGLLCATTITTIHYLARRQIGTAGSLKVIKNLLSVFEIAAVNRTVVDAALERGMPDFEDSILHESALVSGANCIVTRNIDDFKAATIPIYTPTQFLQMLVSKS